MRHRLHPILSIPMKLCLLCCCFIVLFASAATTNEKITAVPLVEDDILLLDVRLDSDLIINALEAYPYQDTMLVAVEPLFDALNVKYQIYADKVIVWKADVEFVLPLNKGVTGTFFSKSKSNSDVFWGNDGFYFFIDINSLANFFGVTIEPNSYQLKLSIVTAQQGYLFPIQSMALQKKQRMLAAASQERSTQEVPTPTITIADQYRLATLPHGRISTTLLWNDRQKDNQFSVQLVSDLLYHSADLTVAKVTGDDLSSRLRMSRYKTDPDKLIFGAFDSYSFGDVSGFSNNLTTSAGGGLGAVVERAPENFRRRNLAITIEETAPPGWEAELYHNNRFIVFTRVPDNGLLVFDDVLTEYGNNYYQIKLYGPFGETEVIEQFVDLTANALAKGAKAYNLYALDSNHRLIDDQSDASREITDFGGTFDYGISDIWQLGLGFANTQVDGEGAQQLYSVKNAFSFPGALLENDFSVNQDGGYAQLTSLVGNGFGNQHFSLAYESASDYSSSRISAKHDPLHSVGGSYGGSLYRWSYSFSGSYFEQGEGSNWRVSNSLSRSFWRVYFTHVLSYLVFSTPDSFSGNKTDNDSLTGSANLSGKLLDSVRLSGAINYDPTESRPILDNSTVAVEWNPKPFGVNNYLTASYQPLSSGSNNWQLSHRVAADTKQFQFTFSTGYNSDRQWSLNAGLHFFLGYDYHNNRAIVRNLTSSSSATLDAHSYLDRQANGRPDPLDYDLQGVEFVGNPDWEGVTSGETGRTILPGVSPNGPFLFGAQWKSGAKTINNDYVVYTHPGAYLDVNMPFYLTSELMGFVERSGNGAPINNVKIILTGKYTSKQTTTDSDGYYEFLGLPPDNYEIRVADEFLQGKGYSSEVVGFKLSTPRAGGFAELDVISLQRSYADAERLAEKIIPFELTVNNSEAIVREEDEKVRRNYFYLPVKERVEAQHSLPEEPEQAELPVEPVKPLKAKSVMAPVSGAASRPTGLLPSMTLSTRAPPTAASTKTLAKEKSQPVAKPTKSNNEPAFTVQLGAFKEEGQATSFLKNLKKLPQTAEVKKGISKGAAIYRVIVGKFETMTAAEKFAQANLAAKSYYIRKMTADELN